jgi:hypothetical protein
VPFSASESAVVAMYLTDMADSGDFKAATLSRRLLSVAQAHKAAGVWVTPSRTGPGLPGRPVREHGRWMGGIRRWVLSCPCPKATSMPLRGRT